MFGKIASQQLLGMGRLNRSNSLFCLSQSPLLEVEEDDFFPRIVSSVWMGQFSHFCGCLFMEVIGCHSKR